MLFERGCPRRRPRTGGPHWGIPQAINGILDFMYHHPVLSIEGRGWGCNFDRCVRGSCKGDSVTHDRAVGWRAGCPWVDYIGFIGLDISTWRDRVPAQPGM